MTRLPMPTALPLLAPVPQVGSVRSARRATTLIELMIAFALLSTAIMVVFGLVSNVQQLQNDTQAKEFAMIVVSNVANRCSGASVAQISAWINGRRMLADIDSPQGTWSTLNDLRQWGLVSDQPGIMANQSAGEDDRLMRFTIGFYRVMDNTFDSGQPIPGPGQQGFWGAQSPGRLHTVVSWLFDHSRPIAASAHFRAPFRITDPANVTQVTTKKPVAVLVMAWMLDRQGRQPRLLHSLVSMVSTP